MLVLRATHALLLARARDLVRWDPAFAGRRTAALAAALRSPDMLVLRAVHALLRPRLGRLRRRRWPARAVENSAAALRTAPMTTLGFILPAPFTLPVSQSSSLTR
jgi:hypothetical protein